MSATSGQRPRPVVLCVLDGFGVGDAAEGNAVRMAKTPALTKLQADSPATLLAAAGPRLGLGETAAGSGEIGHLTLGAGRALVTARAAIDGTIHDNKLSRNAELDQLVRICLYDGAPMHLIGLISSGGADASLDHLLAMVDLCDFHEISVSIHAILDGYDSAPQSAVRLLDRVQLHLEGKRATIATLAGRYYAMDGDGRWDRVHRAFHAMVRDNVLGATAKREATVFDALSSAYRDGDGDAFVEPVRIGDYQGMRGDFTGEFGSGSPIWEWTGEDCGLAFHHRGDGLRQLAQMLTRQNLPDEVANDLLMDRDHPVRAFREHCFVGLTRFGDGIDLPAAFAPESVPATVGELIARAGMKQLRCAESEKRLHVTSFFNGWRELPFDGEEHAIVASPRLVDRYHQKPEMSASKLASKVSAAIAAGSHDFILVNLANADLVARSGKLDATIAAVEAVDHALGQIAESTYAAGGALLVTADHGNAESMLDSAGKPSGAHTKSPVLFLYACRGDAGAKLRSGGDLADVAPTVLDILGLERPAEMTGRSLRIVG